MLVVHACVLLLSSSALGQVSPPLSLAQAISSALKNNPEARASSESVDASRGRFWKGISPGMPEISFDYDYIPNHAPVSRFGERRITLTQSFDFPTSYVVRGSLLSNNIRVAQTEHQSILHALTASVKRKYFQNQGLRAKLSLAEEAKALALDFARKAELRFTAGEGSNLEVLTAKAQLAQAENMVEIARNDVRIANSELNLVLGLPEKAKNHLLILTDSLTFHPLHTSLAALREKASTENPQIKRHEFLSTAASAGRALAWSAFLPSFRASYGWQSVPPVNNYYSASIGISLPLWFMLDQRGQIQEASASLSAAEFQLLAVRNSVLANVESSYYEAENGERQVRLYQSSILPQSEEVHRTALRSYEAGESTYLEYLQARQTLLTARSTFIDLLIAFNSSVANLELAVGQSFDDIVH